MDARLQSFPRDPSTSSKGTWTLLAPTTNTFSEGTWILRALDSVDVLIPKGKLDECPGLGEFS